MNICSFWYLSTVFFLSCFTDAAVIAFVLLCCYNMDPGCQWQGLIYGPWSLRSPTNICSTGFIGFLLWDESGANISLSPALLSVNGLAFVGWHKSFSPQTGTIRYRQHLLVGMEVCWKCSGFDWIDHPLSFADFLALSSTSSGKCSRNISLVGGGSQYDHCLLFLVWTDVDTGMDR